MLDVAVGEQLFPDIAAVIFEVEIANAADPVAGLAAFDLAVCYGGMPVGQSVKVANFSPNGVDRGVDDRTGEDFGDHGDLHFRIF